MNTEITILVWKEALEQGYLGVDAGVRWADKIIAETEKPDIWIIEMSVAKSSEQMLDALSLFPICSVSIELELGFLCMQWLEGKLDFREFLIIAGNIAHITSLDYCDDETMWELSRAYDYAVKAGKPIDEFLTKAKAMFSQPYQTVKDYLIELSTKAG
ncbi:MAG: hypothetical protein KME25_30305 [Symplocastrum torsivum CPER-KK1]|jgi:hypothetical protein|uniref:Uncharacterized protein n=1 Tax=Symplocastrum torsivum CPER-KK1 TaxID=450513 RepID=A0A951UCW4_9CYAN|nr:hypothetical protein [Symplocastrum torsivum CPER-KK1]